MRPAAVALIFLVAVVTIAAGDRAIIPECAADLEHNFGDCAQRALALDGAVSVHVPGLSAARRAAFLAVARCTASASTDTHETRMPDGSRRRSLVTKTVGGVAEPLAACAELAEDTAALRSLVDGAAHALMRALQPLQRGEIAMLAEAGAPYPTLAAAARAGDQLEHFHAYRPPLSPAASSSPRNPSSTIQIFSS